MNVAWGRISISITHPYPLTRHVYIVADRPISEFRMARPLPDISTPEDVANQFALLLRQSKSLTKNKWK